MRRIGRRLAGVLLAMTVLFTQWPAIAPAYAQERIPEIPDGDFRFVVKEDFIVEQMEGQFKSFIEDLSAYGIPIGDPEIDLKDDNMIEVSATTELPLGTRTLEVRPTVVILLAAEDNQMTLTVESVRLEGLALPASLIAPQIEGIQEQLQEQLNTTLVQTQRLIGLELAAIYTTEEVLILDFDFNLEFYRVDDEE